MLSPRFIFAQGKIIIVVVILLFNRKDKYKKPNLHHFMKVFLMKNSWQEQTPRIALSIKSDKKGYPVFDIIHQLLRRSKKRQFLPCFVIG